MTAAGVPAPPSLILHVHGLPVTQGSIRSLGAGRPSVHSNAKRLKPWRAAVVDAVVVAGARPVLLGPVRVHARLTFPRPAGHYGSGRNSRLLKPSAPLYPETRSSGDIDKHARALLDALTEAGVWRDDSQVVDLLVAKRYAVDDERPGAVIHVKAT